MSHYRIIDSLIDNDTKFNNLPNAAQHVWFRIYTNQFNTAIGAYRTEKAGLAERYKYKMNVFNRHFQALITHQLIRYDDNAGLIWFPNFMR